MLILRSCRCNPRLSSTDGRSHHGPCWWSVVNNCNPSPNQLRKLAKSRLTDRTTVRGLCSWIETALTQPNTNYGRPARTVIRSTVRRFDRM
ncbi:hypothetical protein MTR67_044872 [Solanum verrucosum]|uniref:Uncharacterized protein n=1 Tax=Solanum verrucosum TaxID=315347 RepID=A0AAF0US01_SOLVR|nr:hypothetical protein MTR67_044872 [Solanum verrucosum]